MKAVLRESVASRASYVSYTTYRKKVKPKERIKNRDEFYMVMKAFCNEIAEQLVQKDAGVFIKDLGYFFVWRIPRKLVYRRQTTGKKIEEIFNLRTGNYIYSPVFVPKITPWLRFWSMDSTFSSGVGRGIRDRLMKGERYKMFLSTLRQYLRGNEQNRRFNSRSKE